MSVDDLAGASRHVGVGFEASAGAGGDPALRGAYQMLKLRSGMVVHSSDAVDLVDMTTSVDRPAGLTLHIVLEGEPEARLDGRRLELGRKPGAPIEGVLINRAGPSHFERVAHAGMRIRKVNITLSESWLNESAAEVDGAFAEVERFSRRHLARFAWRLDPGASALVEQMLRPPAYAARMRRLYLESRALELIAEGFTMLSRHDRERHDREQRDQKLSRADRTRLGRIEAYLEANGAWGDRAEVEGEACGAQIGSLEEIARACGVSVSTLSRLFRAAHGVTLFEHLRGLALERARRALEQGGASVAEAAYLAGYASAANFATAFRRRFGLTPSAARRR